MAGSACSSYANVLNCNMLAWHGSIGPDYALSHGELDREVSSEGCSESCTSCAQERKDQQAISNGV